MGQGWIGSPQDSAVVDPSQLNGQVSLVALLKGLLAQLQGAGKPNTNAPVSVNGATIQQPVDLQSAYQQAVDSTTTALAANASYVGPWQNVSTLRVLYGTVFSDQAGTMYVDQSPNGVNADYSTSVPISAGGQNPAIAVPVRAPYARLRVVNGATAQTTLRAYLWGSPVASDGTFTQLTGSYATWQGPFPSTVVPIAGIDNAGRAATVNILNTFGIDNVIAQASFATAAMAAGYNGSTWDRLRAGNGTVKQATITTVSTTAVWTPASGKRFRLLGAIISTDTAQRIYLQDGTNQIIASFRMAANSTVTIGQNDGLPMNGYLSAAANNVLNVVTGAAGNTDVTLSGTEE